MTSGEGGLIELKLLDTQSPTSFRYNATTTEEGTFRPLGDVEVNFDTLDHNYVTIGWVNTNDYKTYEVCK